MRAFLIDSRSTQEPVWERTSCVEDWPKPDRPGAGAARIRTLCSAFNHLDLWIGRGLSGIDREYPLVSGCDACGVVEEVGASVDRSWVGRRVIFNAAVERRPLVRPSQPPRMGLAPDYQLIGEHSQGAHAEFFVAPVEQLADAGKVDAAEAAAFGLTFLTAWSMMVGKGKLRPGQWVLITGIGGGVATAALAIARYHGCRTLVTSRHAWKLEAAVEMGADECILDKGSDWSNEVRTRTGKRGVDMVVDTVGKTVHLACIKSLARGGSYVTAGCTSGSAAQTDLARLFWNQLRILGSTMGSNEEFREIAALLRNGSLRSRVDSVHAWNEAPAALRRLEEGRQLGKVVLRWSEG